MIISASRRTDIPALYSEWFMNRLRAGWCLVPNPVNSNQVTQVSLALEDVDAVVFWSKNPAPMLAYLDEMDSLGFRYYFQFTLNDYPSELEPGIPGLNERIATFLDLSRRIGQLRVVWRYDPIIISNVTPFGYHSERFSRIAEQLSEATGRVMVSIIHFYKKTERRLSYLEQKGFSFDRMAGSSNEMEDLLRDFAAIAGKHGMEIFTCAQERDYSDVGVLPGRCIDESLINRIWGLNLRYRRDPGQRKYCRCTVSRDIGMNDTCIHGCPYCYSTRDISVAERCYQGHDPSSPAIWNSPETPVEHSTVPRRQMRLM